MKDQIKTVERFHNTPHDGGPGILHESAKERMYIKTCEALAVFFDIQLEEEPVNEIAPEVQERINMLEVYEFDNHILAFDGIHLYKKELAYPNGYYEAHFFEVIGYNETLGKRKNLGKHDAVMLSKNVRVDRVLIYADGSTFIGFGEPVFVSSPFQAIEFSKYMKEE